MPTIDAAESPELANQLIEQALNYEEPDEKPDTEIIPPPDTVLTLPGGYYSPITGVITEAEVRELTGRDEEAIARSKTVGATLSTILKRGVVKIGDVDPDDSVLDGLLSGDRDYLLLNIFAVTFGAEVSSQRICASCGEEVEIKLDVTKDIPVKALDETSDRYFEVECSVGPVKMQLPTGYSQKAIMAAGNKSWAELSTILLSETVLEINGIPLMNPTQVRDLPIRDRRKLAEEIANRNPGPQFAETKKPCPECGEEMEVPLHLASLFQF
jgi:hypothetical protein